MDDRRALIVLVAGLTGSIACAGADSAPEEAPGAAVGAEAQEVVLGPADGHDLPGTDLDRVAAGDMAPDFTAMSLGGEPITLSDYRGEKNVILVFYRGHW